MTDTAAIAAYEKTLCGSNVYKYAESYCRVNQLITLVVIDVYTINGNNK